MVEQDSSENPPLPVPEQPSLHEKSAAEARREEERMQEVLLLLDHLFRQENITLSLVVDCLYDVASVNLINQKLRSQSLNCVAKWVARPSKPIFRRLALRWVRRNCPALIANWLHSQVKFSNVEQKKALVVPEDSLTPTPELVTIPDADAASSQTSPALIEKFELSSRELLRLRSQVKFLTATLITVSIALGSTVVWLVGRLPSESAQSLPSPQTVTVEAVQ